ncbi:uncharacterized protein N7482_002764 [Penicillium canariense]|uniref:Methyltransferase domain-containing protein n=1 Tax=Penicillium canariense TaxID=189055 RepID=A0A9W9II73_9EURO|nr:uncharacterized protein N7482_002764 [Penicillium canariense]KAJ5176887.1 hypothetical protein N7482_002764 [Penicillium canariense]
MARNRPLPLADEWETPDTYIQALLRFATTNVLFMNLCGGVHILDFLTREPDLYTTLLPEDWRAFFEHHDIHDILRLLLREDIEQLRSGAADGDTNEGVRMWNGGAFPPQSLLDYIHNVRQFSLRREFKSSTPNKTKLPRHVAVGMKTKKKHEVEYFSRYVASLSDTVGERRGEPVSHIVDFGSGQNYLGRTLASSPYHKHIIAIERKHQYIAGAKDMDISAKLAPKEKPKTVYVHSRKKSCGDCNGTSEGAAAESTDAPRSETARTQTPADVSVNKETADDQENVTVFKMLGEISLEPDELLGNMSKGGQKSKTEHEVDTRGTISYIEHNIQDGYLEPIIDHVVNPSPAATPNGNATEETVSVTVEPDEEQPSDARVMVVSLHSCGNLVHHGVRSLILNPSVVAVAMIGCCYNLMTERLGPATYKLPVLRSLHPRLQATGTAYDPHGFPMSKLFETYESPGATGMKFNITARMMAVQAPYNWGYEDSESFFSRHYFRALIQRIFVDRGVVPKPGIPEDLYRKESYESAEGSESTTAVIIGSLGKHAFKSFNAYVRAATTRLLRHPVHGPKIQERIASLTDEEIHRYETEYFPTRKNLSIVWSLMAFSAQVVEAVIVVDRWQFLREHDSVKECWVEPVFEYSESPRNLAVIGLKK